MQLRVRAVIKNKDSLLTIKRVKPNETYWVLPGGGIEDGESNLEALIRECKEELGVTVEIGQLLHENLYVHEKFGAQKEYFYRCTIIGGKLGTGDGPEYQENNDYEGTHEIEWLKLDHLEQYDLRPGLMRDMIINTEY